MNFKMFAALFAFMTFIYFGKADVINVTDDSIKAGDKVTWTADNTYILNGFVFAEEGAVLTIEPGTIIKGKAGQGEAASALVITRGAQIFAEGTPEKPIIFTAEADDPYKFDDMPIDAYGLWGGLIILGKSQINPTGGVGQIEGIPSEEPRGAYGGGDTPDLNDNSGVLRYISIRHGGTDIGANNEINGLSLGAVGAGTTIDHIEVFRNADDGFEFFGGTVNTKYLIAAYCEDDAFDYDMGFNGKGQFWFSIQSGIDGNHSGEHDGGTKPEDAMPYAKPVIYNATYIGSGVESKREKSIGFYFGDNAGGTYKNSVFTDFGGKGIYVEDLASGEDSRARLEGGDLVFNNNIWYGFAGGNELTNMAPGDDQQFVRDYFGNTANKNWIEAPMLRGITRTNDATLDPRPQPGSPALTRGAADYPMIDGEIDPFFTETDYVGAFGQTNFWLKGWTMLDAAGYLSDGGSTGTDIQVFDSDIKSGDNVTWSSENTYHLNGFVFVEEGATLNIEAGTVIKGLPGQGEQASALIICRGAKIKAVGTPDAPIIFTAEIDDVTKTDDIPIDVKGLWGGLIILGKSQINPTGGVGQIEGIPSNEPRGAYGGGSEPDLNDNSGTVKYVSIRHGGTNIGANNEINGLSLGAVGAGTTIEYVEVYRNADDGFEFFGGTVNTKYLISAFNEDDSFDYDMGFNGKGQFWFSIQAVDDGNHNGEHDGGTKPEDAKPYAKPVIYNATYIGSGVESKRDKSIAFAFADNSGGTYKNSIFTDFGGKGIIIEDLESGEDCRARLDAGDLVFNNNIWYGFAGGNSLDNMAPGDGQAFVREYFGNEANKNWLVDPLLMRIGRDGNLETGTKLDPKPAFGSPATTNEVATVPADEFFTQTNYIGAFSPLDSKFWMSGWTFLDKAGFIDNGTSVEEDVTNGVELVGNYPNPFATNTTIKYNVTEANNVSLTVYDATGNKVANLVNEFQTAGVYTIDFDSSKLANGVYFLKYSVNGLNVTKQLLIIK